ncbi:PREDICTED: seven transmembrane domain-containing tyrosine-protein kinase 1-like [Populus euphratica]|uniref:Seven transmembrane domain-containing tyrosine-protein kinase 1-like n=2 Tax=Populus euphratica TaxID=75702 RepID=A0AAJ6XLH5_POPEU|nr:PREDICTED: seven transmembrane domain-containing tyrosine-protein kinase 1-like [Populus euphratica]
MEGCNGSSLPSKRAQSQAIDSEGPYRLLSCSSKGDKAGVLQELEKGVEPNLADYDKRTALHLASCEGCTEVVILLLEKGADVNSIDRWGRTPLSDARSFGHEGICKILEARGGIDPVGLDSQTACYEIDYSEVDMDDAILIGEGSYGEVYLVKWRGTEVAAKTIRSSIASDPRVRNTFLKELGLWQKLRHPNIVQFLGVLKHSDRLIFLTEYLRDGSLYDILKRKGRLDQETAVSYALDIARGMNYLHQHKPRAIIHRDLTPRNVLQDESGHLKVTDFGLSKIAQEKDDQGYMMTGGTGSYRYMAPEVYRRESYGKSVDVFSFALIVHEIFQGGPSNRTALPEHVADKRAFEDARPSVSSFVYPDPIKMLLRECWHKNPESRPTFEEIISKLESIQESFQSKKDAGGCCSCCIL